MFDWHKWLDIATRAVFVASILHSVLPPWDAEAFRPFPSFMKYYKLLIYILGYVAINARSTLYKSISIETPGRGGNGDPAPASGYPAPTGKP
jgi:hypothetical protein